MDGSPFALRFLPLDINVNVIISEMTCHLGNLVPLSIPIAVESNIAAENVARHKKH